MAQRIGKVVEDLQKPPAPKTQRKERRFPEIEYEYPAGECSVCGDLGYTKRFVPTDHPDFGKVFPCPNPLCRVGNANRQTALRGMMADAGVKEAFRNFSFATWDALKPVMRWVQKPDGSRARELVDLRKGKRAGRVAMEMYVRCQGEPFSLDELHTLVTEGPAKESLRELYNGETAKKRGVILAGINDTGKTGLIASAALALLDTNHDVLFVNTLEMLSHIMSGYGRDGLAEERRGFIKNAKHLFMDEMTFTVTDQHRIEIQEITRHRSDAGLPMVMTTNFSYEEFEQWFGPQITSGVLRRCHWVELDGEPFDEEIPETVRRGKTY